MSTTSSIGTASRNYSTIAAWVAAFAAGGWIGECYNDSEFLITSTINISPATSAANFLTLRCATGQSFKDNANAQTNALDYNQANGVGIRSTTSYIGFLINAPIDYVTIDGLQLYAQSSSSSVPIIVGTSGIGANSVLQNCIFKGHGNGIASAATVQVWLAKIRNCLIITNGQTASAGWGLNLSSGAVAANCTVIQTGVTGGEALQSHYGTGVVNNCAMFGFGANATIGTLTGSNNATDNSSVIGTSGLTSQPFSTATFKSITNDFRLVAGSTLINAGFTDTTDIPAAIDIVGTARPQSSAWDIGAWEFAASSIAISRDFTATIELGVSAQGNVVSLIEFGGSPRSTVTIPAEYGAGVQATMAALVAILGSVSADMRVQVDIGAQARADIAILEESGALVRADQAAPVETAIALRRDQGAPIEFGQGVALQITVPIEFAGTGNSVVSDIGVAIEWGSAVVRDAIVPTERGAAVMATASVLAAVVGSLAVDGLVPVETAQQARRNLSAAVETLIGLVRDQKAPASFSASVLGDCTVQVEFDGTAVIILLFDPKGVVIGRDRIDTIVGRDRKTTIIGN